MKNCGIKVLYTPCDRGASKDSQDVQPRVRQNVVLSMDIL